MTRTLLLLRATRARATHRLVGEIAPETTDALATFLADHAGKPVRLLIDSPGGLATEGASMAAEVERHGQVEALGQGVVASAATLPFLAARRGVLHSACMFMIHDPQGFVVGNATTMRKWADDMDAIGSVYADFYARQTGQPVARVQAWMNAETWMSPDEALALNFCDAIEKGPEPEPVARFDYSIFAHAPAELVRMAAENGWTAEPSEHSKRDP